MIGRLVVIHTILAGLLAAGWYNGILQMVISADHVHLLPVICLLIGLGSLLAAFGKWGAVDWLAEQLPSVGLVGTVAGLLLAAQIVIDSGGIITEANRSILFVTLLQALASNMMGISGKLWLNLVERVCK